MPRSRRPRKVKVVEEKLGRINALGEANLIERTVRIDPRQTERQRLDTMVHEALHLADWGLSESKVCTLANKVSGILWQSGYRRVQIK